MSKLRQLGEDISTDNIEGIKYPCVFKIDGKYYLNYSDEIPLAEEDVKGSVVIKFK